MIQITKFRHAQSLNNGFTLVWWSSILADHKDSIVNIIPSRMYTIISGDI